MVVPLLLTLPGCGLLDSIFGTKEEREVAREQEADELTKELQEAAVDILAAEETTPKEELTGKALVTMRGEPIVTSDSLQAEEEKLLDANPELKQMFAFMDPMQLRKNLAEGLMNQSLVDEDIKDRSIDQDPAYKKEMQEGFKAVKRMVNTKYFTQAFDVRISDTDARKFYDNNKDTTPQLIVSRGGTKAMGVQFDTEADARAFSMTVGAQGNDIKKAAQDKGLADKVRDFGLVGQQSINMDQDIKTKILAATRFPVIDVVKTKDNKWWVVVSSSKEETQYRPFDQVKAEIKDYLEKEERAKQFDEEINKLKKKYDVHMDEEFFAVQPGEEEGMENAGMAEDLLSQLEDEDVRDTVAFHNSQRAAV